MGRDRISRNLIAEGGGRTPIVLWRDAIEQGDAMIFFPLVLAVAAQTASQPVQPAAPPACPAFASSLQLGPKRAHVELTPVVEGAEYNWTVSAGTLGGNGAPSNDVDLEGLQSGTNVEISVDIGKLGPACPKGVSMSGTFKVP